MDHYRTVVIYVDMFQGQYYQEGDIVSLVDHEGGVFYAQIRGFMCDQYNEKSAVITWLLPTQSSPADKFDASTYILGKPVCATVQSCFSPKHCLLFRIVFY